MEQGPLFNSINFYLPYSDTTNLTVSAVIVNILLCPSEVNQARTTASAFFPVNHGTTNYGWNLGDWYVWSATGQATRGAFTLNKVRKLANFTDGLSGTILVAEVKTQQPAYFCFGGLSQINNPAIIPPAGADPNTVAPEYSGSCGPLNTGHSAWVDGNAQEPA